MTNNWLISYPKSGSNFIRYCIEFMTGSPTEGKTKLHPIYSRGRSPSPVVLNRRHGTQGLSFKGADKVCFLLRDYKELYYRPGGDGSVGEHSRRTGWGEMALLFNEFLTFYKRCACRKRIIYYEDIISRFDDIEVLLTDFYDLKLINDLEEFKATISYHREQSLSVGNPYQSDARSPTYYQDKISIENLRKLDEGFEEVLGANYKFVERYRI